jgi:hypothetical protein
MASNTAPTSTPTPAPKPLSAAAAKKSPTTTRAAQKRTFHFFIRVTDEQGDTIPGAKLTVERIMTDARKVVEFLDTPEYATSGLTRIKYEVVATARGNGEGDEE